MSANWVLYNGLIRTLDARRPLASGLVISGERIVAVGDAELRQHADAGGKAINLGGRLVIPGLIDAHVHLEHFSHSLRMVDLFNTRSAEEAVARVAARAAHTPPGQWLRGWGWVQELWPGRQFPNAARLDAAVPDHPVCLVAQSGHAAWVNSRALLEAGISAETPDPPGGRIARDEHGQPNGILFEDAIQLVEGVIPAPSLAELSAMLREALAVANRAGVTGVHDFDGARCFQALQMLHAAGALSVRVLKNIPVKLLEHALELGLRWGFGDDFLRIGGVKMFADGALGSRTASMLEPFEGEADNYGIVVTDKEQLLEDVRRASQAGLPSAIHAIGDRALREVLDVYQRVRAEEAGWGLSPEQRRHRIEHVQLIHPDDGARLGQLHIIASMQPVHITSDMGIADQGWGDRADYSYNWRLQLEAGAPVAFGSDVPVEPINPMYGIHAAVTRRRRDGYPGPEGWRSGRNRRLSVEEAVRGFTSGAAYAAGLEDRLGRLAPGYLADLVILDRDIFRIDPMEIHLAKPVGVMVGGRWVVREV